MQVVTGVTSGAKTRLSILDPLPALMVQMLAQMLAEMAVTHREQAAAQEGKLNRL